MSRDLISCVIACYKDAKAIPYMYKRIKKIFLEIPADYEIIFVNDASPDESLIEIQKITKLDSNVLGINHRRNFGSQSAFLSGMKVSKGDAVVLLDGDLQDPPELIKDFYSKWKEGYEIVYGIRAKREVSIWLQIAYKTFYKIFNKVASFKVPLNAGDFSLIDRKSVKEILQFKEFDIFLRAIRAYIGGNQIGVSYIRPERMFGRSTNNLFKNIGWATKGILSVSRVPLTLISFLASICAILMILFMCIFFIYMISSNNNITNLILFAVLLLNVLFSLVIFLSISVVGEYVGRILEESKQRPKFLVSSYIFNGKLTERYDNEFK